MSDYPYAGTSGWSGTETSRERVEYEDAAGISGKRRQQVLTMMLTVGPKGVTWKEVSERLGLHHGQASGALSVLHKLGYLVRLKETRQRCKVYVLPQDVLDRPTEPFRPNRRQAERAPVPDSHFQIVDWLDRQSKSPDQNIVYQGWAQLFRNAISRYDYLEK